MAPGKLETHRRLIRYETRQRYSRLSDLSGGSTRNACYLYPMGNYPLALMIAAGLPVLLDSFARFAIQGLGTPAPVAPPQHLVVTGLYRWMRNPMYVAVSLLIFGQGLLFGSVRLLEYGLLVWLAFFTFVVLYEEPALSRKFGKEYEDFCLHVPRWIPRLKPVDPRP
jgi:protein-S-isoprenylcysteine O-methyltransferase Ste14